MFSPDKENLKQGDEAGFAPPPLGFRKPSQPPSGEQAGQHVLNHFEELGDQHAFTKVLARFIQQLYAQKCVLIFLINPINVHYGCSLHNKKGSVPCLQDLPRRYQGAFKENYSQLCLREFWGTVSAAFKKLPNKVEAVDTGPENGLDFCLFGLYLEFTP